MAKKRQQGHPPEKISGYLMVGTSSNYEAVINFAQPLETDAKGRSFMTFSPRQARNLARLLNKHANEALLAYRSSSSNI